MHMADSLASTRKFPTDWLRNYFLGKVQIAIRLQLSSSLGLVLKDVFWTCSFLFNSKFGFFWSLSPWLTGRYHPPMPWHSLSSVCPHPWCLFVQPNFLLFPIIIHHQVGLGPTLMASFEFNHLFKGYIPIQSTFWDIGFWNFNVTIWGTQNWAHENTETWISHNFQVS